LSGDWFYVSPGFEPAIATLFGIAGVISSFLTERGSTVASSAAPADTQRSAVSRSQVEHFLDDLMYWEDGPRFQALAVVLAKKRWRDLVASERKWDHGLDAYAPPGPGERKTGKGLASSLTATLDKVKKDAERACASFSDLGLLIFYTPQKVTNRKGSPCPVST
jgi:hypothetical protein